MEIEEETRQRNYERDQEFLYSDLQFKNKIIDPISGRIKNFEDIFNTDLIITNLNSVDIQYIRTLISTYNSFVNFNLKGVAEELFLPEIFSFVNTARSRDGFERKALITIKRDDEQRIQATQNTSLWDKLRGRGR